MTPDEEALREALRGVAEEVLAHGRAQLEVEWWRWDGGPVWPDFVLSPTHPAACRVSLSPSGAGWTNFSFGPSNPETTFEIWAEGEGERLALLRECVEAVRDGRFEIELRRTRRLLPLSRARWRIIGTFHLPSGPRAYSRSPADIKRYRFVFGDAIAAAGQGTRLGPHRFSRYN